MYIEQAFKYLHSWWRYLVGFIIILFANQIGSIPFVAALILKTYEEGGNFSLLRDPRVMLNTLDSNLTLFLMLLSFAAGLAAIYYVMKLLHWQPFRALTTARKKMDWNRFFFGFGLIGTLVAGMTILGYYLNPEDFVLQFEPGKFLILFLIAIVMIPIQTAFEEYLFRGYLMQGLGVLAKNRALPLILTSVVFGLLHFGNPEVAKMGSVLMFYYIGTGFFLGIITLMDDGLELALGYHAGNNLITALLVTSDWSAFQTYSILKDVSDPAAGSDVFLPLLVIYPLFLFIMARKYNWTDWKTKLFGKIEVPDSVQKYY